jgi:hypothetical protein
MEILLVLVWERGGGGYLIGDVIYLNASVTGIGLTPPTLGSSPSKVITIIGVSTLGVGNGYFWKLCSILDSNFLV